MISGFLLFFCFLLFSVPLVSPLSTTTAGSLEYYLPGPQDRGCNAPNSTRICDASNLLSESEIAGIQGLIDEYEKLSIVCHDQTLHSQLGVYIEKSMELRQYHKNKTSSPLTRIEIKKLAMAIRRDWKLGLPASACGETDVLLCVVIYADDKSQAYISRGRAMIANLPYVVIQSTVDDATSLLRQELYRDAIESIIVDLTDFLRGDTSLFLLILDRAFDGCVRFALPLLCFCCLLGIIRWFILVGSVAQMEKQQSDDLKRVLQQVKDRKYVAQQGRYQVESCQICQKHIGHPPNKLTDRGALASEETPLVSIQTAEINDENDGSKRLSTVSLRCGHQFHSTCLLQWMSSQRQNHDSCRCPVCMQGI